MGEINCLDIGTTKIMLLSGRFRESEIALTGAITVQSKGIRKGLIIDMEEAASSIKRAIKEMEERFHQKISSVVTGFSGGSIEIFESYGAVATGGRRISERDIENAIESASSVYIPLDRELLHVIPVEYVIDGEHGIRNPIGMKGFRLEARVQIITAPVNLVENFIGVCEQAGLKVEDIIFKPVAIEKAVLKEEEIEEGVLLIEIGGGMTDIAVFKDRRLIHAESIPVGGNHITNDLAIGLRIPVSEAEKIKIKYGSAIMRNSSEEIEIDALRTRRQIPLRLIDEIIHARVEEMLSLIKGSLEKIKDREGIDGVCGAVLTGGSSSLNGLDILFESLMGLPVRIGYPDRFRISGLSPSLLSPQNSLAIGLLHITSEKLRRVYKKRFLIKGMQERLMIALRIPGKVLSNFGMKKSFDF